MFNTGGPFALLLSWGGNTRNKVETSVPDPFAIPWFALKYGSQKRTKGIRTGQKLLKQTVWPWFTLKTWVSEAYAKPWLTLRNGSQNRTKNCLTGQIYTTLQCPLLWSSGSEVSLVQWTTPIWTVSDLDKLSFWSGQAWKSSILRL